MPNQFQKPEGKQTTFPSPGDPIGTVQVYVRVDLAGNEFVYSGRAEADVLDSDGRRGGTLQSDLHMLPQPTVALAERLADAVREHAAQTVSDT